VSSTSTRWNCLLCTKHHFFFFLRKPVLRTPRSVSEERLQTSECSMELTWHVAVSPGVHCPGQMIGRDYAPCASSATTCCGARRRRSSTTQPLATPCLTRSSLPFVAQMTGRVVNSTLPPSANSHKPALAKCLDTIRGRAFLSSKGTVL
jgi:hypothetical protein